MAKMVSRREPVPAGVFASDQHKPSVQYEEPGGVASEASAPKPGANPSPLRADSPHTPVAAQVGHDTTNDYDPQTDWRMPYLDCLIREMLPADKTEARRLARRAKSFVLIDGDLYKKSHTKILQRYIPTE